MVLLSLSPFLLSLCFSLVKIQVTPTISPTVNSKLINRVLRTPPVTEDLTNIRNVRTRQLQYKVDLEVGTPPQRVEVVVDTGSEVPVRQWTWVPDCTSYCNFPNNTFNPLISNSWRAWNMRIDISYNIGRVYGQIGNDTLSFDLQLNSSSHPIIVADSTENLQNLQADGVMVRTSQGLSFPFEKDGPVPVVWLLYDQGLIEAPVFSVFLNNNEFTDREAVPVSALLLGGYELDNYSHASDFTYIPLVSASDPSSMFWSVSMTQIAIGEVAIELSSTYAILDTGSSYILAPSFDSYRILDVIKRVNSCAEDLITFVCKCESETWADFYPVLVLVLGPEKTKVRLNPQDYFFRVMSNQKKGECQLLIDSDPNLDYWVLGAAFLRKYYVLFDMERRVIGLAPSVLSVVVENFDPSWREWMKVFVMPIIGALLFFVAYIVLEKPCGQKPPVAANINQVSPA